MNAISSNNSPSLRCTSSTLTASRNLLDAVYHLHQNNCAMSLAAAVYTTRLGAISHHCLAGRNVLGFLLTVQLILFSFSVETENETENEKRIN